VRSLLGVLAVVAGAYIVVAVLVLFGTFLLVALLGAGQAAMTSTGFLLANALLNFLAAMFGGYLAARYSPPGFAGVTVAGLMFLFVLFGAVTAKFAVAPVAPVWYLAVVVLLGASAVLVGAMLQRSLSPRLRR
jgi:hypothetical protein